MSIYVRLDGHEVSGWTSISYAHAIDDLNMALDLSVAGVDYIDALRPGLDIEVADVLGTLFSGEVVGLTADWSTSGSEMQLSATSLSHLLAISSPVSNTGQNRTVWKGKTLNEIAGDLASRFGLEVRGGEDVEVKRWRIKPTEKVGDNLQELARQYGYLLTVQPEGSLLFWRPEEAERGNLPSATPDKVSTDEDWQNRNSEYLLRGQLPVTDLTVDPQDLLLVTDQQVDAYRGRYCPLLLDVRGVPKGLRRQRAVWESNLRAGRSKRLTLEYSGSDVLDYPLRPGIIVDVDGISFGKGGQTLDRFDGEWLINSIDFSFDTAGSRLVVGLVDPLTYSAFDDLTKKQARKEARRLAALRAARAVGDAIARESRARELNPHFALGPKKEPA